MLSLPWGILLLVPLAWLLFMNKGRFIARACRISRRNLLWYIFFVLLGGFINITAGRVFFNLGGLLLLALGGRLWWQSAPRQRLRLLLAALVVGVYAYCFETGVFWWLIKLSIETGWLLPLVAFLLALLVGGSLTVAWGGLIWGLLIGEAAAGFMISRGAYLELGNFVVLNSLFLAMAGAAGLDWLRQRRRERRARLDNANPA